VAEFVVTRGGRESFHDEASLKKLAASGLLLPGDLVYHPLLGRWLYAREVEEVRREMAESSALGQPVAPAIAPPPTGNPWAVAGFVCGILGMVPLFGVLACIIGLYCSARGLHQKTGQPLAVVGLVLSILFLLPAVACGVLVAGLT
jgi:hypothetical protein